jgi:TolB-like protein
MSASFFSELKRRNVLRAGALYIGAAWALSQGVAQLLPVFGFDNWVVRWFVIAAAIGFPFAMLFSWFYEWTPQGIVRESEVAFDESITRETGRKMDRWIIAVLSIAVVLLLADIFVPHKNAGEAAAPVVADKSIAVLPLFNMSGDAKDAYLGDGISEEVLNALSKLPGLKVIGRASSFQFRDRDVDAVKVGHLLNVRSLLSGTVQRDGENLRISVELVDTAGGTQIWSQHYDRDFKNLFALEDDISSSVSTALAVQLGAASGQPLVQSTTSNAHAHDLYLQAKKFSYNSDEASLNQAVELFNQAIAEDSSYAAAWAGLAYTYAFLADAYRAPIDVLPSMKGAAEKAVALDPGLAEAHAYLGYILLAYERDFPAARRELDKAVALNPGSADAHFFRGLDPLVTHNPAAALAEFETAEKIDPYNPFDPFSALWAATAMGDEALAIRKAKRVLALDPKFSYFTDPLVYAYGSFGRWKDCVDRSVAAHAQSDYGPDFMAAVCYAHIGDKVHAQAILDQLETAARTRYVDHANIAEVHMALGDRDGAMAALEQAFKDRSQPLLLLWYLPEFKPMQDDPRFKDLMGRIYSGQKPAATP